MCVPGLEPTCWPREPLPGSPPPPATFTHIRVCYEVRPFPRLLPTSPSSKSCSSLPPHLFHLGISALQVLPDVLHVCELGLCGADTAEDAQLEATLSILPLVGAPSRAPAHGTVSYLSLAPLQIQGR